MTVFGYTLQFDKDFIHKVAAQAAFAAALAALGVIQASLAERPEYATAAAILAVIIASVSKK